MSTSLDQLISAALEQRRASHLLRSRRIVEASDAVHVIVNGRPLVNFASNNYLGLTHHASVRTATDEASGAGAAGLITGYTPAHARAEADLAAWKQTEAAVILQSGYQANLAAVQTLHAIADASNKRVRFIVDRLAHASLIDAVRQVEGIVGRPVMRVFPHNDIDKVERLLRDADADELQVVVTESIFSMDGDAADLAAIASLKTRYAFALLVDEAHAAGIYGPNGAGLVSQLALREQVDITIATLSKALGVSGGAVCASRAFIDALLNFGRAYIYSTSVSPVVAQLASRAIDICRREPERRVRVMDLAARVRSQLHEANLTLFPGDSPIIPILLSDESSAIEASKRLEAQGLLVLPVRPPTVPRGTSRLRVTLSCEHSDGEVDLLVRALLNVVPRA
jgi:8-amino-7-oxononanoate synthase